MREIEKAIGKEFVKGTIPTGKEICEKQLWKVIDDIEKTEVKEDDIAEFLPAIYRKLDWLDKEDIIRRVVTREFGRFVEYYSNAPEPEPVVERSSKGDRSKGDGAPRQRKEKGDRNPEKGYARFFVNRGKRDGFYAAQVIDMVNRHVKHERIDMGRIDLMQNFSFFEVPEKQADVVLRALKHAHVNGQHVVVELAGEGRPLPTSPAGEEPRQRGGKNKKKEFNEYTDGFAQFEKRNRAERRKEEQVRGAARGEGGQRKPSREERGYTGKRGPMKKDDWKQFFQQDERPLRGAEPDFSEEGWARRKPKKR